MTLVLPDLAQARAMLRERFGYGDFRPGQAELVSAVLRGSDALGVLPTGGGKSVCYQVPALLLPGVTLVVSPLISLMEDQLDRARAAGLRAAAVNAAVPREHRAASLDAARRGRLDLLLVAPERLGLESFRRFLAEADVALVAVDEAHCISEWGHDFRPSYRMLGRACRRLGCPILALTATASPDVRRDIVQVLDLRTPVVAVASFDRPNLEWRVEEARGHGSKIARLWGHLRAQRGPAIVYAGTRRTVEAIRRHIAARGLRAVAYHAGLAAHERAEVQAEFMQDRAQVVVATTAFGMGIDKPDVRSVLHYQLPSSLESYYQEAGRAGRDGRSARCIALYAPLDARLHQRFVDRNRPDPVAVRRVWRRLVTWHRRTGRPASLSALVRRTSKRNGRERIESVLAALRRDGRIEPVDPGTDAWEGTPSAPLGSLSWVPLPGAAPPDLTRMYRLRRAALDQIAAVERYATTRRCRRRELLEYFGQRTSGDPCGACDRCRRARS